MGADRDSIFIRREVSWRFRSPFKAALMQGGGSSLRSPTGPAIALPLSGDIGTRVPIAVLDAMLAAELTTKPHAAGIILAFVLIGVAASIVRLWWLWYTLWEQPCCGNAPRNCTCSWQDRQGL